MRRRLCPLGGAAGKDFEDNGATNRLKDRVDDRNTLRPAHFVIRLNPRGVGN
jgi:hypothetical protein